LKKGSFPRIVGTKKIERTIKINPSRVAEEKDNAMVKDIVCGMKIKESTAAARTAYNQATYYFCTHGCSNEMESALGVDSISFSP